MCLGFQPPKLTMFFFNPLLGFFLAYFSSFCPKILYATFEHKDTSFEHKCVALNTPRIRYASFRLWVLCHELKIKEILMYTFEYCNLHTKAWRWRKISLNFASMNGHNCLISLLICVIICILHVFPIFGSTTKLIYYHHTFFINMGPFKPLMLAMNQLSFKK